MNNAVERFFMKEARFNLAREKVKVSYIAMKKIF